MNQATEKDNRDQQIGRSIASAIQQQPAAYNCLSDQQLASLLDNRMPSGERERCMAHIAACDSCLARYSMTATLLKETPQAVQASQGQGFLYAGLAVAAVAVLAIGLVLQQQPGKTSGQLQSAGHSAIGGINTTSAESARLHQRLKIWSDETIKAIETKQYDKIDKTLPAIIQQEARQLGDTALADKLEPLVKHLAEPQDTDEWYGELGRLVKGMSLVFD
ncbi:hypothetical protein [Trichlorobacter lovleyi]|uniref:hypothetical protein n=1 Tax=Trichlorobacter lovleyi TaxID=313985 RepID=UPI00223EE469|nr:hypothetical protein [Trichlorobacter lovleyi]